MSPAVGEASLDLMATLLRSDASGSPRAEPDWTPARHDHGCRHRRLPARLRLRELCGPVRGRRLRDVSRCTAWGRRRPPRVDVGRNGDRRLAPLPNLAPSARSSAVADERRRAGSVHPGTRWAAEPARGVARRQRQRPLGQLLREYSRHAGARVQCVHGTAGTSRFRPRRPGS